jgi:hypothetical protein
MESFEFSLLCHQLRLLSKVEIYSMPNFTHPHTLKLAPSMQAHLDLPFSHSHTLINLIFHSHFHAALDYLSFLCLSFERKYQQHRYVLTITFTIYSICVYTTPIISRCFLASWSSFCSQLCGCPTLAHIVSCKRHSDFVDCLFSHSLAN